MKLEMQKSEPPEISSKNQELRKKGNSPICDLAHLSVSPASPQVSAFKFQASSSSSPLLPILLKEIDEAGGAIPFRRFMELALYHPELGYYASGRARIGKEGDFFTSVSVGRIYGRLLASICREAWELLGAPSEFTIIEQGANDGTMASDILETLTESNDACAAALRYLIVEPFSLNRERQQQKLAAFPQVSWIGSLEELSCFSGIHLSNELLDAFPVDSLRWNGDSWEEEVVVAPDDQLCWKTRSVSDPDLAMAAALLPTNLATGFRVEVNPGMRPWLHSLHRKMDRGLILTVDYGQSGEDRYAPHRADGTLLAYQAHQRFDDPLPEPGLRDITAQIDFTTLARQAREEGFEILGYSDQHHFLVGAAEPWLRSLGDLLGGSSPQMQKDLRALQTLLHPSTMGRQFKAIAFGKNFPVSPQLSCFKFQRPGVEGV
jgi:SAM-dependent MidA family methyltransferase